ncbi:MAG: flagellar export protein FliJ [bacterium]
MARFRLQRVLEIRKVIEKEKEKDLSLARITLQREKQILQALQGRKNAFAQEMNQATRTNVQHIVERHLYLNTLLSAIDEQCNVITAVKQQVETKRQHLLQATQDKKVLEKLQEKKEREFLKNQERQEQGFLDELARSKSSRSV